MSVPSDLQRMTTITDSVFAVSVTLLAYSVRVPQALIGKPISLTELTPFLADISALVLSFCIASLFWLSHRRDLQKLKEATPRLIVTNLAFLLTLVLLPMSTHLFSATALTSTSAAIYSLNLFLAALARFAFRTQANALSMREKPARARTKLPEASASIFSIFIFGIALGAAFVNPRWSELFWTLGFFTPLIERLVRRANQA